MKTITSVMTLLGSLALVLASPAALPALDQSGVGLPLPYNGPMQFSGSIGGYEVHMNGTIEDVFAHLKATHPGFNAEQAIAEGLATRDLEARDELNRRGGKIQPPLCCPIAGQPWTTCNIDRIGEGIKYLIAASAGHCGVDRGCKRLSCSYNSAIYICNDNNYNIAPNCGYLATYAQDIIAHCANGDRNAVCGQLFDYDRYNIIVRRENC